MDGSPVTTSYMVTPNPASSRWARILVSLCSLLFGVSAWVSVNGLWVQMPLLVPVLPEGWNLGSVLVIVIQVANVGPLVYTLARNYLGLSRRQFASRTCILVRTAVSRVSLFSSSVRPPPPLGENSAAAAVRDSRHYANLVNCDTCIVARMTKSSAVVVPLPPKFLFQETLRLQLAALQAPNFFAENTSASKTQLLQRVFARWQ
ncbi:hypothetical protein HPB51_019029 [Rhipicephalus microplus]|uniref:Riboflavin transporter n=1 Tax=Rhipicephalus microplus TaxID=6941 RepID=A0A9J6D6A5_RHIMP|nr:hypothetical protein HPB51_019029 [Rhipicephalus microplus]